MYNYYIIQLNMLIWFGRGTPIHKLPLECNEHIWCYVDLMLRCFDLDEALQIQKRISECNETDLTKSWIYFVLLWFWRGTTNTKTDAGMERDGFKVIVMLFRVVLIWFGRGTPNTHTYIGMQRGGFDLISIWM